MKIRLVVYNGGKWEIVNGKLEYVADADSSRRGLEIEPNLSYTALLSKVSTMCSCTNNTKLSYRLSSFSDPIDIINDEDLAMFYNFAMENIFEIYKLYVVEGLCARSSSFSPPKKFLVPGLNFFTDEENYDVVNDYQPNPDNSFEICLRSSSITFEPGHVFNNKEDMKLELGKKCLLEHFEFKVDRSSKTRYQVSCLVDGYVWRFRARSFGDSGVFFVKSFNDKHTCSKTLTYPHVRQANPNVVAHYLKEPLKDSGRIYCCNEIVKDFRQRFQVEITTSQAWRGKSLALELLQGSSRDSFAELPFCCYNLEQANPGSVTHIKTDDERRFEMVFVAIGDAIRTFICNLRPVVIIDAAHLKGEFKGTLFLAVGMDGNNQILPISYGIGKSEDGESWTWFLSKLKECETDCSKYCFPCYSNEVYKKTYEEAIYPLPHRSEWETPEDLINLQPPHMTKRQAGRPRENNRILSGGEEPTPLYYSRCNSYGHHRDVCRQPMPSEIRTRKDPDKGKGKETDDPDHFTQSPSDYIYPSFNLGDF
ncbi:uncharacterized protein LOC110933539 [Helianthus annuus]|uniref:uncharacterized protein LOC110933539 n=1 Tax=Helianthus annuus TaxID=4232 RepID=UPI000B8FE79A|nr:uncharacterized protein LOC110933539 [Helianthus annuus]